jgi:hypothetical protein
MSRASTPIIISLDQSIIDFPAATPIYDKRCSGMGPGELHSLSWVVDDAVKMLDPNADGWAEGIMQDCYEDNVFTHVIVFGMWFYIDRPTHDLKDYDAFGLWITDVMNLLDTIPRDKPTLNAKPTVVNFRFYSGSEFLDVRVPIKRYLTEANKKTGEELFRTFHTGP